MSLTRQQVQQLLKPINASRVLRDAKGQSHVSQHDIRAHLTRIFGFANWSTEIVELRCIRDTEVVIPPKNGRTERTVPAVTYLCRLRLDISNEHGHNLTSYEDVGTGTSPNLPDYGDAHDFAAKNAVSYALKRCAVNLGDQFGLSLYNGGQTSGLVLDTLVKPDGDEHDGSDVQEDVPKQLDMGDEHPGPADVIDRIMVAAVRLGWDDETVENDFAREHGGLAIGSANPKQLADYAVRLEVSTPDVVSAA